MIDPGVTEVASVLACLFFLVAGANQVKKFLDGQKDKPAPADVRADLLAQLARTEDCIARHNAAREETAAIAGQVKEVRDLSIRLDREWQHKLDERMEHAEDRSRKEIGELHEKINGIGREVSEMSEIMWEVGSVYLAATAICGTFAAYLNYRTFR